MLIIGLPIFIRVQIPLRQKIPVVLLFSLGIFVIVCAILNKIYSFTNPFGSEWVFWYVRESSTALIVANMPFVWSFYRRLLHLGSGTKETARHDPLDTLSSRRSPRPQILARGGQASPANFSYSQRSHSVALSEERPRAGTTAEEMLRADYLSSPGMQGIETTEVNPYTHPALYYALTTRRRRDRDDTVEEASLEDGIPGHDDTHVDAHEPGHAPSIGPSTAASSSKRRSLGSFV